jgi:hypothetical protein
VKVHEKSPEVMAMEQDWAIIDPLMDGTRAMRASSELLPQWPGEAALTYANRLASAVLYPAFRRTVKVMSGKPFSKQVTLNDDVPEAIKKLMDDVDQQGSSLHVFAQRITREALSHGLAGVLIDYTREGTNLRTRADEQAAGARPYWVWIKHNQILGWRSERDSKGVLRLTQLRLEEVAEVPDGDFGVRRVKRVRVLEPGRFRLFEEQKDKPTEYKQIDEGEMRRGGGGPAEIPFVAFFGEETGFMQGRSPLMDLAHLNVKHWQSQSDQDNILHVARVPILAIIGADTDDLGQKKTYTISANQTINLPVGADAKYVEHSGAAIGAGRESLKDLEEQMVQTGAELLVVKPGERSATEAHNDAEGNKSDLQRIIENVEDALDECLQFTAEYLGEKEGGHVELFKDFGVLTLSDATAQMILTLRGQGLITKGTALSEMQRRGILSADVDIEDELEQAEAEGPPLGMLPPPGGVPPRAPTGGSPRPPAPAPAGPARVPPTPAR